MLDTLARRRNHVLLSPIAQLSSALTTAATAIVAAQKEQFTDIASFSAGLGIAGVISVFVGAGTSFTYVSGTDAERYAVRYVRWRLVAPATIALSAIGVSVYFLVTFGLSWKALLLGAFAVTLNSLASIESATLQRYGRIGLLATITVASRSIPLLFVLLGVAYSVAMTASAFVLLVASALSARVFVSQISTNKEPVWTLARRAFRPAFVTIALLDILMLRTPTVIAPVLVAAPIAGVFATLVSSQQGVAALLTTGLFTILAARGPFQADAKANAHKRSELVLVLSALPVTGAGLILTPQVLRLYNATHVSAARDVWILLVCSLIPLTYNRATQYKALALGQRAFALQLVGFIAVPTVIISLLAIPHANLKVLASATLIGEVSGSIFALAKRSHLRHKGR